MCSGPWRSSKKAGATGDPFPTREGKLHPVGLKSRIQTVESLPVPAVSAGPVELGHPLGLVGLIVSGPIGHSQKHAKDKTDRYQNSKAADVIAPVGTPVYAVTTGWIPLDDRHFGKLPGDHPKGEDWNRMY